MNPRDKLRDNLPDGDRQDDQAVIICLQFPIGKLEEKKAFDAIFDLCMILRDVIETSRVGLYAGYEFSKEQEEESVKFFISGKDANKIYQEIKPIIQSLPSLSGFYIIKRYLNLWNTNLI